MDQRGWSQKAGVVIHKGQWQDVVGHLPAASFDANGEPLKELIGKIYGTQPQLIRVRGL